MELEPIIQRFEVDDSKYQAGLARMKAAQKKYAQDVKAEQDRINREMEASLQRHIEARRQKLIEDTRKMNLGRPITSPLTSSWATPAFPRVDKPYYWTGQEWTQDPSQLPQGRLIPTAKPMYPVAERAPWWAVRQMREQEREEKRRMKEVERAAAIRRKEVEKERQLNREARAHALATRGDGWTRLAKFGGAGLFGAIGGLGGGPFGGLLSGFFGGATMGGPMGGVLGGIIGGGVGTLTTGLRMSVDLLGTAIDKAYDLGKAIFQLGVEYERVLVYFQVFTESQGKAAALVKDIREIAVNSPFRFDQLSQMATTLLGYGTPEGAITPTVSRLSMLAGGDEARLHRLSLAYSQVISAGRFMGQELRQFAEAGIGAPDFAKTLGIDTSEFRNRMQQGLIGSNVVTATVNRLTDPGGRFFGVNEQLLNAVGGRINALVETLQFSGADIGTALFKRFEVSDKLRELTTQIERMGDSVVTRMEPAFKFAERTVDAFYNTLLNVRDLGTSWLDGGLADFFLPSTWEEAAVSVEKWGDRVVLVLATVSDALRMYAAAFAGGTEILAETFGVAADIGTWLSKSSLTRNNLQLKPFLSFFGPDTPVNQLATKWRGMNRRILEENFNGEGIWRNYDRAEALIRNRNAHGRMNALAAANLSNDRALDTAIALGMGGGLFGAARAQTAFSDFGLVSPLMGIGGLAARGFIAGMAPGSPRIPEMFSLDEESKRVAQAIRGAFHDGVNEIERFRTEMRNIDRAQYGMFSGTANPFLGGSMAAYMSSLGELSAAQGDFGRYQAFLKLKGAFGSGMESRLPSLAMAGSVEAATVAAEAALPQTTLLEDIKAIMERAAEAEEQQQKEMEELNRFLKENPPVLVKKRI